MTNSSKEPIHGSNAGVGAPTARPQLVDRLAWPIVLHNVDFL